MINYRECLSKEVWEYGRRKRNWYRAASERQKDDVFSLVEITIYAKERFFTRR
jgi:hypothetical protein